ncbi:hypothetical protein N9P02_00070 [bacterium]|nr:hypothetical protein [bacterium]
MRKLLLLLLFVPILSFGQILIEKRNKTNPRIDITKFEQEIISVIGKNSWRIEYGLKNKKGKKGKPFYILRKTEIYDANELIKFQDLNEVISFFTKWGYDFEGTDTRTRVNPVNGQVYSRTTSTFRNNNNSIVSESSKNKIKSNISAKDNAINELKKLKELLDLELITQEEFDAKSKELKKIILGN